MKQKIFTVYLLLFASFLVKANNGDDPQSESNVVIQDSSSVALGKVKKSKGSWFVEFLPQTGFMAPSSAFAENILNNNYLGLDLRVGKETNSQSGDFYDYLYRYPSSGFGFYACDLSEFVLTNGDYENLSVANFGQPNALYGFMKIPIRRYNRWETSYQLGVGLSYDFVHWDQETNPANIIIGSRRNVYIDVGTSLDYDLTDRWQLGAGLNFKHFSNGSSTLPNLGINLLSVMFNARYSFVNETPQYKEIDIPDYTRKHVITMFTGQGAKMIPEDFDRGEYDTRYLVSSYVVDYHYAVSHKRRWGGGIDFFYRGYGNHLARLQQERDGGTYKGDNDLNNFAMAIKGSHELVYDRISMFIQLGVYVLDPVRSNDGLPFYERLGAYYSFGQTKNLFVGVAIKAHGGQADYVEYTLGYRLFKDTKSVRSYSGFKHKNWLK